MPAAAPSAADAAFGDLRADEPFRVIDHVRWPWLLWGTLAFTVAIGAVAGWMGLRALAGLAFAVFVLWWFVVPRLLAGQPPVAVALAGCALIAVPALLLTHGVSRDGFVPLAGIAASLTLVGLLASAVVGMARLSGLAVERGDLPRLRRHPGGGRSAGAAPGGNPDRRRRRAGRRHRRPGGRPCSSSTTPIRGRRAGCSSGGG